MKIQLLNKSLSKNKSTPVLFPYPPVALPISQEGFLVKETEAKGVAYSTFVFSIPDETFYLFEFGEEILDGLLAYRTRHKTITNVEVLLSRDSDGSLRMTTGNTEVRPGIIDKSRYEEYLNHHDKIFERYMSKLGRKMHEYA